jgi:hypothetical protein
MATDLIDQADIERRIGGPATLVRLTDDNGDGIADAAIVAEIISEASGLGVGLLWNGFPSEPQITTLVDADISVKNAIVDIACALCGQRRPEWVNDRGEPMMLWRRKQGEGVLRDIVKRDRRSGGEATAGTNTLTRSRRSARTTSGCAKSYFANSDKDPKGPGGF